MSIETGRLYIVATPIGNTRDISARAVSVLAEADVVYAEDTRRSARLFLEIGVSNRLVSLHEHNEDSRVERIIDELQQGLSIALISDAGTPLISDPGYRLVSRCLQQQLPVTAVPGASALISALSISGLPTDSFVFLGFPPARAVARKQWFSRLAKESRTLVMYESRHRIVESLRDMGNAFGEKRLATIARELTKTHETVMHGSLESLVERIENDENQQRGEIVVLVAGSADQQDATDAEVDRVLRILLRTQSVSQAAQLTAELTGCRKKSAYALALQIQQDDADHFSS